MPMPFNATWPVRLLVPAALSLALAGCAGGGNSQGTFGAPAVDVEPGVGTRISDQAVAGVGGPSAAPPNLTVGTGANAVDYSCPVLDVRTGAGIWQVPGNGGLKYQATIATLARECAINGTTMTMKVGIEGRVVLGEKGTPGGLSVPIRIAVVQEGPNPKTITSKFFTVPLNIPAGENQLLFSVVEDQLSFPLSNPADVEKYVVYVGFDPKGGTETSRPRTTTSKPRPATPAATAPAAAAPAATAPAATSSSTSGSSRSTTSSGSSSSSSSSGTSSGGGFAPPPSSSGSSSTGGFSNSSSGGATFGPPPGTFAPAPSQ